MSYAAPPPSPFPPTHVAGASRRSTRAATIVVIVAVVILQFAIALVGLVLTYVLDASETSMTLTTIATIVLNALVYAVVAAGAAYIARTPTGRLLGIVLPMLSWLLSSGLWYGLPRLLDLYSAAVASLLGPLFLVMVLAGWGCAAWTGRRWLIGLPVTYLLLLGVHASLSLTLTPDVSIDNIAVMLIVTAFTTLATTLVLVLGGVVCWLLDRTEQAAGQ
ncbi:hypothetical protein [Nocardioides luteus]|uniref:Uncharacterized protein n=1 Tax=Nocardioides luteus TaxID=1844 RepID=A0A1J4N039_9ACTN|nr:hypothetical protein [Nocardioides luteus]OIJ24891.1 hypothetical protein UG56_020890 [Nocardioides luteus]